MQYRSKMAATEKLLLGKIDDEADLEQTKLAVTEFMEKYLSTEIREGLKNEVEFSTFGSGPKIGSGKRQSLIHPRK